MHAEAYRFVARATKELDMTGWHVLEIGARNVNGTVRPLFERGASYLGLDIAPGPGVDVVADAATWSPLCPKTPQFNAVVCCEVLEHAENAEAIVRNAHRLLVPLGVFIMTCAGPGRGPHSAVDGGPLRPGEFYRNVDEDTFRAWASDFSARFANVQGPDLQALCVR